MCWESQAVSRTLEMAFSVTSTCMVWVADGGWHLSNAARPPSEVGRVWGQPWQLPGTVVFTWLSLLALWNSPAALDKREQNKLSPTPLPQSPLPPPVCSYKTCPAHSQALRPAESINPVVPCAPAWGSSPALVSCQGAKKETALCWHWPPGSFGPRDLGVSRGWREFTHERIQGCCPRGAPLEQCR